MKFNGDESFLRMIKFNQKIIKMVLIVFRKNLFRTKLVQPK